MNKFKILAALMALAMLASGCGETISGIGKDAKRIGKGVKTVFIRDSE